MVRTSLGMPENDLKHFVKYLDKLRSFAKAIGIKIIYKDCNGHDGFYVPTRSKVYVDSDLSESSTIAVVLHELGHCMDITFIDEEMSSKTEQAFTRFYSKKKRRSGDKRLVVACETRAWRYGRGIADRLRIPLGKWYDEAQESCLTSYKKG